MYIFLDKCALGSFYNTWNVRKPRISTVMLTEIMADLHISDSFYESRASYISYLPVLASGWS